MALTEFVREHGRAGDARTPVELVEQAMTARPSGELALDIAQLRGLGS